MLLRTPGLIEFPINLDINTPYAEAAGMLIPKNQKFTPWKIKDYGLFIRDTKPVHAQNKSQKAI